MKKDRKREDARTSDTKTAAKSSAAERDARDAAARDAAARGAELGSAAGAALGAALGRAGEGAGTLGRVTASAASRGVVATRQGTARVAAGGLGGALHDARTAVAAAQEILDGVLENARERGPAAVAVLAGRRPPRRWPWAVGAAVAGAAAGAGVALVVRRVLGQDAPGAQEPDQLVAVVDAEPLSDRFDRPTV